MNGVDYAKKFTQERENFHDTIQKTRDVAQKRISETEKNAEYRINNQKKNHIEDRAELEQNYQKNLDNANEKTKTSLEEFQQKFSKEQDKEREEFAQESLKKSKDFNRRLDDIKNSYQKTHHLEKMGHQDAQALSQQKYKESLKTQKNDSDKQLNDYQNRMTGAGASLKDQFGQEREQLVRSLEGHATEVHRQASEKRLALEERLNNDINKSKETHEFEKAQQKMYHDQQMSNLRNVSEKRNQLLANDYSQRSDALAKSKQKEAIKSNREHQEHVSEVRRDFNSQLRKMELDKIRNDSGSGETAEVLENLHRINKEGAHEHRIKNLNNQMTETKVDYQERALREQENLNQTLKAERAEQAAARDRLTNIASADKLTSLSKEKEKVHKNQAIREKQAANDKEIQVKQNILDRATANERLKKLNESFIHSVKKLEEGHKSSIEDLTAVGQKEKTEFAQKLSEARNNELFEIKKDFNRMMDSTIQDYEQRISKYQSENEKLKMAVDLRVDSIINETDKKIEAQRQFFEESRLAEKRSHQAMLAQKENQYKLAMTQTNTNFQKKVDKMEILSNTKLKMLTDDYETKLNDLRTLTTRELAQRERNHQTELKRIESGHKDEKSRIIESYESQIASIKDGHREQLNRGKDFNRLS